MTARHIKPRLTAAACVIAALSGWTAAGTAGAPQAVPIPIPGPGPGPQRGQPPPQTGTGFIAGQIVESPSGAGVAGATVLLSGRGGPTKAVIADSQGRFFFANLPASTFILQVDMAGYMPASPSRLSQLIELGDGERTVDLKVRLAKFAALSGTVRDEVGDPVVGIEVRAFRRVLSNGRRSINPGARTKTDDRGAYRFAGLQPGDYIVCACGTDPNPFDGVLLTTLASEPQHMMGLAIRALAVGADAASLDKTLRTYAPAFHPSSQTVARATTIKLGPAEEKTGIDVEVASVRATRVSGTIVGASGSVTANEIRLTPAGESAEATAIASLSPMLVQPDNRFDFVGVPPGQYVLSVFYTPRQGAGAISGSALQFIGNRGGPAAPTMASTGPPPTGGPQLWAAEPVTVGEDGVSGLSISLRRVPIMSGRVEFVGSAPQPTQRGFLSLSAIDGAPLLNNPVPPGTSVRPDNTFELANLWPGRYFASPVRAQGYPTLKSVTVNGVDVTDLPITVEAADITGSVITMIDTPMATLSGTLAGSRDPSAPDLTVLVFPSDRKYWVDPFAATRRFRSTPIGRSGSYTIPQLPAGEYFVAVVPDEATVDWIDPAKIDALSKTAQRVQVADGDKKILDVKR